MNLKLRIDGIELSPDEDARHRGALNAALNAAVRADYDPRAGYEHIEEIHGGTVVFVFDIAEAIVREYRSRVEESNEPQPTQPPNGSRALDSFMRFEGEDRPQFRPGSLQHFTAPTGSGKTATMIEWAAKLSRGVDPTGGEAIEPVKTLYLHSGEDSPEKMEAFYRGHDGVPGMLVVVEDPGLLGLMLDADGFQNLREAQSSRRYGMMVFDPVDFFLRDANDVEAVRNAYAELEAFANRWGVCAVVVRHARKASR